MEEDYLWKSGMVQYEMRLLLEGALALYEDESSTLLRLAIKNERYEAADALDAIGSALNLLRDHVCDLQKAHRTEVLREVKEHEEE